ncbi:MAG: hypothetical protein JWQ04_3573, partial [Pedosphaera sp.]|nr:hypothetical protein [Pedosphaera sp.]
IVVDDGSNDATAALATQAGAEVLRHQRSRGKGAALNTGWQRAVERGFSWALAMDGDGQHLAADIPTFLSEAVEERADLIVGNRFGNPGAMPWLRRAVNQWMSRRLSRAAGIPLPDSQCGFRLMRLGAWSRLNLQAEHFEVESEVLLAFAAKGFAVRFVPVQTIYGTERSKIDPVRDTWRWFRWWAGARGGNQKRTSEMPCPISDLQVPLATDTRKGD